MNHFVSQKFRFYSFLSMFFLVYLHGYNLNKTYLFSASTVDEKLTFTTFTEHLLANGLFRFRIPMLFVISGFLYALTDHKLYTERTKKRFIHFGGSVFIVECYWFCYHLFIRIFSFVLYQHQRNRFSTNFR